LRLLVAVKLIRYHSVILVCAALGFLSSCHALFLSAFNALLVFKAEFTRKPSAAGCNGFFSTLQSFITISLCGIYLTILLKK
jgi:uncharacterized membrane protein